MDPGRSKVWSNLATFLFVRLAWKFACNARMNGIREDPFMMPSETSHVDDDESSFYHVQESLQKY
jgi:hypothetical protein